MGSCLIFGDELSEVTHMLTKKKTLGRGHPGRQRQGKGTQNGHAMWLAVSGFMGIRLTSELSLASPSDSGSFPLVHPSLSRDGFQ